MDPRVLAVSPIATEHALAIPARVCANPALRQFVLPLITASGRQRRDGAASPAAALRYSDPWL
jgi:hypothetical protein